MIAKRLETTPGDFPCCGERVEIGRVIAPHARRQNLRLEDRRRERRSLKVLDRIEQRIEPETRARHALPAGEQAPEDGWFYRLDLLAQSRERSTSHRLKHVRIAPLASGSSGPEFTFQQPAGGGQGLENRFGRRPPKRIPLGEVRGRERPMRSRKTPSEIKV